MAARPNIILFMTDQQRADFAGTQGPGHAHTPTLDRLAAEGAVFTNAFCTAPSCVPSRASFFNCRYPHSLRVYHNHCPWSPAWVAGLRDAGYHTVNIGKMHTVPMDAACGFDERFAVENKDRPLRLDRPHGGFYDEWDRFLAASGVRKPSRHTYRAEDPAYETALGAYEWPLDERFHPDVFVGNTARWFVEGRKADAPLFLQVGFPGPHPPYDPPRRFLERYEGVEFPVPDVTEEELAGQPPPQRVYRGEMVGGNHDAVRWRERPPREQLQRLWRHYAANVTLIDEQIGLLLDALARRGYLDNAVVLFMSDHGDCLGEHGHIQKWTMYDAVTRVPMLLWGPGRVPAGRRVQELVQHFDAAAALLDFAGVPQPAQSQAVTLAPLLEAGGTGRDYVFAEHPADNILKAVSFMTMVRGRGHKLVHYLDQDCGELYDLARDPGETRNLWTDPRHAAVRAELLGVLRDWRIRLSV